MKLITEQWLNNAQKDLDVVQEIIHRDDLTNAISFHAQQAIEKSFNSRSTAKR
jgi:HEPN domain-containing protein